MLGICETATSRCAFPDDGCGSGFRYPPGTDRALGGECVQPEPSTTSTGLAASESTGGSTGDTSASTDQGTTTGSESTGSQCTLAPADPSSWSDEAQLEVAEQTIVSADIPALRIEDSPNAVVRDLDITFEGSAGIVITDSPGVTIERIRLHNAGAPESGPASLSEIAIRVERSNGAVIRDVFVEDARSGVVVIDSDDATLERIWVNDVRGEVNSNGKGSDEGGDCVLLQTSARVTLTGMGCTNEPDGFEPHAGVFVDRCADTVVEDGIAENIDQGSGAGVRVHTISEDERGITVRDFDVVGGSHACYDVYGGLDVTLENTGCRNHDGTAWASYMFGGGPYRVIGGRYYNVERLQSLDTSVYDVFDVMLDQFVPRLPPAVRPPCDL